jgi:hypothetical protein
MATTAQSKLRFAHEAFHAGSWPNRLLSGDCAGRANRVHHKYPWHVSSCFILATVPSAFAHVSANTGLTYYVEIYFLISN